MMNQWRQQRGGIATRNTINAGIGVLGWAGNWQGHFGSPYCINQGSKVICTDQPLVEWRLGDLDSNQGFPSQSRKFYR